jgi:hypothetical protein
MPTRSEKKKRRGKIFIIALAALIFAETGYILGVTGLGDVIFATLHNTIFGPPVDFSAVLSVSEAYVFFNGTVTRGRPEYYRDAYVYVVAYAPGVSLPDAVVRRLVFDAAERPVYVLPKPLTSGAVVPQDFADVLPDNAKNPVVLLVYPMDKISLIDRWLQGIRNLPQGFYIRIHLVDGKPVSAVSIA